MKSCRLLFPLLLAGLSLLTACQSDPLAYHKGTPQDLADRIERFAEALDAKFEAGGFGDEERTRCTETFTQYADETNDFIGQLTIDDTKRIVAALGRISGVVLKGSAGKLGEWIKGGMELLPGFVDELKSSIFGSDEIDDLQQLQETLLNKIQEWQE